jgi:hypothetical protein
MKPIAKIRVTELLAVGLFTWAAYAWLLIA